MRVLNAMLGCGRGGIETSFANYAVALQSQGIDVTCCVAPHAKIIPAIATGMVVVPLPRWSQYDPRAVLRAAKIVRDFKPDVILVHAKRSYVIFSLMQRFFGRTAPLVQVLHRTKFDTPTRADHVITVSRSLREQVIARGMAAERVTAIPNFLASALPSPAARPWHTPPVIGVLGRLVPEKGIDLFLDALALLKQRGFSFHVRIGGSGPLETQLKEMAAAKGLGGSIEWLGWVEDNAAFYESIDLFCLPSRWEAFGMVLLEAFARGKPIVSTATSGPGEIIVDGTNGILTGIDAASLADGLARVLSDPALGVTLATAATKENARYSLEVVAPQIAACLRDVIARFLHQAA